MTDPIALGLSLVALFGVLLALLAIGWRWFARHRSTLYRVADAVRQRFARFGLVARLRRRFPRTLDFIRARLSPSGYLGLHLTIGLLLSLGALVFFGAIVEDIANREEMALLDGIVGTWIRAHVTPGGTEIVRAVSFVGAPVTVAAIATAVAITLAFRREWILLSGWSAALIGGGLLDWALKAIFRRPRPEEAGQILPGHSWSFPSGHAMGSVVTFGMLAYLVLLSVSSWPRRLIIAIGATLLVLAIGLSRLYLGVHYFTDVVGGFAGGVVWLSACISGIETSRRRRSLERTELAQLRRQ